MRWPDALGILLTLAILVGLTTVGLAAISYDTEVTQEDFEESREKVTTPNPDPFAIWRVAAVVLLLVSVVAVILPHMPGQVGGWK